MVSANSWSMLMSLRSAETNASSGWVNAPRTPDPLGGNRQTIRSAGLTTITRLLSRSAIIR
jgi:hypothetical protein